MDRRTDRLARRFNDCLRGVAAKEVVGGSCAVLEFALTEAVNSMALFAFGVAREEARALISCYSPPVGAWSVRLPPGLFSLGPSQSSSFNPSRREQPRAQPHGSMMPDFCAFSHNPAEPCHMRVRQRVSTQPSTLLYQVEPR